MHAKLFLELQEIAAQGVSSDAVDRIGYLLNEEGINSPSQFADLLINWVQRERQSGSAQALDAVQLDPFSVDDQSDPGLKITHRVPQIPFYVNGITMEPEDIARFDGQPLHFMLNEEEHGEPRLIACERYRDVGHILQRRALIGLIRAELAARDIASRPAIGRGVTFQPNVGVTPAYYTCPTGEPPGRPPAGAQFFEDINFGGDWFWLDPGWQYNDLRDLDWSDMISSIKTGDGALGLFDHIHLQGDSFTMAGQVPKAMWQYPGHPVCGPYFLGWDTSMRQNIANLVLIGWNDRISSIAHWPQVTTHTP
jgi:hypothetical protein